MSLSKAIEVAAEAHGDKKDMGGVSYILHPIHVMMAVKQHGEDYMTVAVLHDIIEDTDWTLDEIVKEIGLTETQTQALDLLTHKESDSYDIYIEKMMISPMAKIIKIEDLNHNLDVKRIKQRRTFELSPGAQRRIAKYLKAWTALTGE